MWLDFGIIYFVILSIVLFWIPLFPLSEDTQTPIVLTMMFMLWHVLINSEDLSSAQYLSTWINATLIYWLLNIVTINLRMSRCVHLLIYGNPKGYEVSAHIDTKVKGNRQIILIFKNEKSIWSMELGSNVETSMFILLGFLVVLVKIQIGRCSSKYGKCFWKTSNRAGLFQVMIFGKPFMSPFLVNVFILVIEKN